MSADTEEKDLHDILSEKIDELEPVVKVQEETVEPEVKVETPEPNIDEKKESQEPEQEVYNAKFSGYTNEERKELVGLPVNVQKIIDGREEKFFNGIGQYKEKANNWTNIEKILAPDREYLTQNNATPDQFITRMVNIERQLRSDDLTTRVQALQGVASMYGVDLNALTQTQFDPGRFNLQQEHQLYRQQIEAQKYSEQSTEAEKIMETIVEFSKTHEHFDALKPIMGDLLDKGIATTLEDAYDKASRLDNSVFEKIQASKLDELKKQEAIKANEQAQKAKGAAASVKTGSPAGKSSYSGGNTMRDAVEAAFAQHGIN